MKEIPCQACKPDDESCYTCGGYKIVLGQVGCPICKRLYWETPRVSTIYPGKRWRSFDGLELVMRERAICTDCDEKRE